MSRRLVLFPTIGFGVAFIAAATLQPVIGSFNKALRFEGDAGIVAAFQDAPPTPVRGVYPITVTPALPPLQVALAGAATGGGNGAAGPPPVPGATDTPTATSTHPPSATSTRAAAGGISTKTPVATSTATKTSTATATTTSTATATATPDPCGPVRDANLVFRPESQTLRGSARAGGQVTLLNTGSSGHSRDLVLRVTATSGARYLTGLVVEGRAPSQNSVAPSIDVRLGDLGPGREVGIAFEATVLWPSASTLTTAVAPSVELRFEVVSDACRPFGAPSPVATVRILAALTPVAIKPAAITATEADVNSSP